ncbi:MAG: response regulator transcription factor [Bacteroidetes bacterium]|nr:response regulator transcription factor [Bacteroidota bacterium]
MIEVKKILVADDHSLIRRGVIQMISEEFEKIQFGEAKDSAELLDKSRKEIWDIIIMDLTMPGGSEMETLKQLRIENPDLPILVLSMHAEEIYAKRVLKAGASGYLLKDAAPEELGNALRKIKSGKIYLSANVAQLLAEDAISGKANIPFHELLSDREMEVFRLIASGKTVSEIAKLLSLGVPTISTYRTRILEKLSLKNNAEIVHFAFNNGVI